MRAGGCTVQQALTTEAANVIKQAVTLAKRRGHAQVTPLHVAATMLAPPAGLLRTACLQSHSHPLQCKALDVCINVALNRLPASSSSPMLGPPQPNYPSISNALVAAFKRAQAHQRRGSVENQQQPLLAVKIELEQLIISILDDPSVSRVMREAGFSSTQVKINVEKAVSLDLCSSQQAPSPPGNSHNQGSDPTPAGRPKAPSDQATTNEEDVASVIESMTSRRRKSIAIVGECASSAEGVVKGLMERVDRGEVPEGIREVKFISLPLHSLGSLRREEVEQKLAELRCLVKGYVERGVVLYLGDLKWTTTTHHENRVSTGSSSSCGGGGGGDDHHLHHRGRKLRYCPVEHMVVELGRWVCGIGERSERLWLMGIATFQTYNRCRSGRPSLEIAWGLHPVNIPEASLSLSLVPESDVQSASESKKSGNGSTWLQLESTAKEKQLIKCCGECCDDELETEAGRSFRSSTCTSEATTSTLPSWLQQYKDQTTKHGNENDQDCVPVKDLCRRWNSFSSSSHKQPYSNERTITFSSLSPSSSTTAFSYDHQNPSSHQTRREWPLFEPKQYWSDHHFSTSERSPRMYIPERKEPKQATLCSNPNSTSSSDVVMESEINLQRFREWNSENLKTLCAALEKRVPWQKDIIPEIASTVLQCRSGMVRRKGKATGGSKAKEETWLFFQGVDADAKEEIARELARLVFGSNDLVSISLSSFSSTRADSTEVDLTNKRSRDEQSCSYIERFAEAVARNPRRVFLVEDVEQADYCSQVGMRRAIERGRIGSSDGNEVSLCDAIVILSCESFSSRSRAPSPPVKQNSDGSGEEIKTSPCTVSLDLNISFDEDGGDCNGSINDVGLLESVDRRVFFKIQEL